MTRTSAEELLQHAEWLRRLAHALVRDEAAADDLVQETWIAALRRRPSLDRSIRPWLAQVVRNLARARARGERNRRAREEASGGGMAGPSAEELVAEHERLRVVAELVSELAEPYRSTVLLCYSQGLSPSAIARREGIPPGTVRWRLKQGLDELRRRLDERSGGDRRRWRAWLLPIAAGAKRSRRRWLRLLPAAVTTRRRVESRHVVYESSPRR